MRERLAGRLGVQGLTKTFGSITALEEITAGVEPGEVLAVTGPSGAGKTTLCRLIAGLELPDDGRLLLGNTDLTRIAARERRVSYLFESYALFPHLKVFDNVASPLRVPGRHALSSEEIGARVHAVLSMLAIDHLIHRLPSELSGGQKQRVGLARALVQDDASVTLLDEPISHLDAKLRHRLRGEIKRSLARRAAPALWATPDGLEALSVGDRVAVLIDGRLEQIGAPADIWEYPASVRVARLIGDPPMSLVDGRIVHGDGAPALLMPDGEHLALPASVGATLSTAASRAKVTLGLKPRAIRLHPAADARNRGLEVYAVEPFGKHTIISARLGAAFLRAKTDARCGLTSGQRVDLDVDPDGLMLFDGASGAAFDMPRSCARVA